MRILVVAMANSIHTARWLQQFDEDDDKQFLLFPSTAGSLKKDLKMWLRLPAFLTRFFKFRRVAVSHFPISKINTGLQVVFEQLIGKKWRELWLWWVIKCYRPDIIHSLEFQHAGYACLAVKKRMGDNFPTWIATNWGSDIYLFSQLKNHKQPIAEILQLADFYSAECARDYELAKNIGLQAQSLPIIPNTGGMHLEKLQIMRLLKKTSQRKTLVIKGYQYVFGRALTALKAVELIAPQLKQMGIDICVFAATEDTEIAAELTANSTGLEIKIIPIREYLPHIEVLKLQASARCYVGLSISDGISTSMLEAMAMGAFPIQTCTSCANEWIENGVSGFIAPYEDEHTLAGLILEAMTNDAMVDNAAEINWQTLQNKARYEDVQAIARSFYKAAYDYESEKFSGF